MSLRYGLIGGGMMGCEHIENISLLDGCSIVAIADSNSAMLSHSISLCGAEGFSDYKAMLSQLSLDAIILATPNDTHYSILLDLLDYGVPILCEKPLCITSSDCELILSKSCSVGVPIWVAMEYRYMPPVQRLLEGLSQGKVGSAIMVSIREHRFPFLDKVDDWNRFNSRTGGTMVEKSCHYWDLMRLVMSSDPVRVYASSSISVNHLDESYSGETPDIIDNGYVVVDFASGSRGLLDLCMFAEGSKWQEEIYVTGSVGRLSVRIPGPLRFSPDGLGAHSEFGYADRSSRREEVEVLELDDSLLTAGDHYGSTYYQHCRFRDFLMSSDTTITPEVSIEDGLWSVRIGEAAELSSRTGESIKI